MAKYSTGSGGGDAGESCELCGAEGVDLRSASVAGATIQVCPDCAELDETGGPPGDGGGDGDRKRRAARNAARMGDVGRGDSSRWEEEGTDYDDDQLPYLVAGYGDRVTAARQDAGLQTDELAAEIDADEADVLAVEQERAVQGGVGGSVVAKLERYLDVEIAESD